MLSLKATRVLLTACLSAGLFLATPPVLALDSSMTNTQYGLSSWMSDDGLPQNGVSSIAQTPDGYLWFGTEEGLARFDGVRFTTFLDRKSIGALLVTRDGSLWISLSGGLARYRDLQLTTYTRQRGASGTGALAESMSEGSDGSIWLATRSGLQRFHNGTFSAHSATDGSAAGWIWATWITPDEALWYGTNGDGLKRLHQGTVTTFTTRNGLADNVVHAIHQDRRGDLWIGTNNGLSLMQKGKITSFPANSLPNRSVKVIQEDRDGNLWIGTEGGGLTRYSAGTFTSFGSEHPLSNASILSLFEDREGSLWVGTFGAGVSQLRPGKFTTVGKSEGLKTDVVWSVRESRDGSLLIGSNHGLSSWKQGVMTSLTTREGLSSDIIRTLLEDRTGGIWLGTNDGLNHYKNGKITVYRTSEGLAGNAIRSLMEDRHGNLWIGSRGGGLARLRDGAFQVWNSSNGLPNDVVWSITEDREGLIWIGTNGGLSVFRDGVFENYTMQEGLSSNSVRATYHDSQGGHWIGTYGGGLNRIKNGRITTISIHDGLFDAVAFAIVEDRRGFLWMTCNRGVYRVSLQDLNDFADGRIKRVRSSAFNAADGMEAAECNGGSPGASQGSDGRLFFATIKGVAVIDPNRMAVNLLPPPVQTEEVLVDGKVQSYWTGLVVGPGTHSLEIRYTALSFIAPASVKFRYRLRGFSDEWVDAGSRRSAFYTNLKPGHYTFELMGSNNDGLWNTTKNPLQLQIEAAFVQTAWFKALCGTALLLILWAGFKMRLRFLQERERLLVTRVDEQTAELTAGKANAEAVAEVNTQLRLENERILNSIADGVMAMDLTGNINLANPAASRMLGWQPSELVGRLAHETVHHSTLTGPYSSKDCPMQAILTDGELRQVSDEVFWRKDGTSFPVHYLAAPILDRKGRVAGVTVTFRDITEQRAIEHLKSEFVSTVSHELRTPLTSIRGALGLLTSGLLGPIADKGQRMLEIAVTNTDRLVRLINDILDLERIESGKVELSRQIVDASAVMVQALEGVQSMADQAGVRLVLMPAAGALWGDSDRIMQTLTNLLGNAIKFSPPDTTVTLSGVVSEDAFVFRIADQGRGVPQDKLESIFARFSQVDASDSRDKGGSGLGLAISQSIVNAHGGRIWAQRNEPQGTCFQFTIPLVPSNVSATPTARAGSERHAA